VKKKNEESQLALAGTEEAEILTRLSERVEKAVTTIQELRRERDALQARVEELEEYVNERGEIRNRIETILESLEKLDEG
jgi:methyl-accepting chemotaxis protein